MYKSVHGLRCTAVSVSTPKREYGYRYTGRWVHSGYPIALPGEKKIGIKCGIAVSMTIRMVEGNCFLFGVKNLDLDTFQPFIQSCEG